jgi:hypothetical protein
LDGTRRTARVRARLFGVAIAGIVVGVVTLTVVLLPSVDPPRALEDAGRPGPAEAVTEAVAPAPLEVTPAIRHQLQRTAQLFVETSVGRHHPERSWQLIDASLRQGLTLADWKTGNIPVVPYPVEHLAFWQIDEANADHVLMELVLTPKPHTGLLSKTFLMDVRPSAGPERWLVTSWVPYGVSQAQMELDAAARGDNVVPSRDRHLSAAWLVVPLALLLLTIVTPAAVFAVSAHQSRRAERLYRMSLPSPAESETSSSSNPS